MTPDYPLGLAAIDREWRRCWRAERLGYFIVYSRVVLSIQIVEVVPEVSADTPEQIATC